MFCELFWNEFHMVPFVLFLPSLFMIALCHYLIPISINYVLWSALTKDVVTWGGLSVMV